MRPPSNLRGFISLLTALPLAASCGDLVDTGSLTAFGNRGTVEVTAFNPHADPPTVDYRISNRKNFLTYLKVEIVVTIGGTDHRVVHEPLGPRDAPTARIAPGARRNFTVASSELPSETDKGLWAYRVRATVTDFHVEPGGPSSQKPGR